MIKANNPSLVSWVDVNKDSDFQYRICHWVYLKMTN